MTINSRVCDRCGADIKKSDFVKLMKTKNYQYIDEIYHIHEEFCLECSFVKISELLNKKLEIIGE